MNVIIDKINDVATNTYEGSFEQFDVWAQHWFETAESIYDEFVNDGLEQSAKFTRDFINESKDALARGKKNAIRL